MLRLTFNVHSIPLQWIQFQWIPIHSEILLRISCQAFPYDSEYRYIYKFQGEVYEEKFNNWKLIVIVL